MYRDVYQRVEKPPMTGVAHRMTSLEGQGNSSGHCSTGCIFTFQPSLNKTGTVHHIVEQLLMEDSRNCYMYKKNRVKQCIVIWLHRNLSPLLWSSIHSRWIFIGFGAKMLHLIPNRTSSLTGHCLLTNLIKTWVTFLYVPYRD